MRCQFGSACHLQLDIDSRRIDPGLPIRCVLVIGAASDHDDHDHAEAVPPHPVVVACKPAMIQRGSKPLAVVPPRR